MERFASAMWKGGLKDGKGVVSSASGALSNAAYGFTTRFENAKGTNPEELVAAAHAGCFSMALSGELGKLGFTPDSIETKAKLNFDKTDAATFTKAAEAAKKGCPISRLLNTTITMSARLS